MLVQKRVKLSLTKKAEELMDRVSSGDDSTDRTDIEVARDLYMIKKGFMRGLLDTDDPAGRHHLNWLVKQGYIEDPETSGEEAVLVDPWTLILPKFYLPSELETFSDDWDYAITDLGKSLVDKVVADPFCSSIEDQKYAAELLHFIDNEDEATSLSVRALEYGGYLMKVPPRDREEED